MAGKPLRALLAVALAALAASPAWPAVAQQAGACREGASAGAGVVTELRRGERLQLLSMRAGWALVRRSGARPCWARAQAIVQEASDVRSITHYSTVTPPSGRIALSAPARASDGSGCPCGSGRSCTGPAGNRYCISRGVVTTRSK